MFKNERQQEILKILANKGYTTVEYLSSLMYTSESSIRRDLTELENKGLVLRSYGGVELTQNNNKLIPFSTRIHHRVKEKKHMAEKAAELVNDGDIVFLDQASSCLFLAQELMNKKNITIVTNNIEILSAVSQSNLTIYSSGGRLSSTNTGCLIGEEAHEIFKKVRADILFFSAQGLSPDGIIYDCTLEEVSIRKTMLENAEKSVFLCDSEKFDRFSGYKQCPLSDITYMVSEVDCKEKYKNYSGNLQFIY